MESYAHTLLSNVRKAYKTPAPRTAEYIQLHRELLKILTELRDQVIDRQQATQQLFQLLSQLQRTPRQSKTEERISSIVDLLSDVNSTPNTILDIGAGTGDITLALKNHYNLPSTHVFAIDQKLPDILDLTPLTYTIDNKIPLPNDSIDLIIMSVVLHHIPPDSRPTIINEISRILSPTGTFIIREHDDDGTIDFYSFIDLLHIFWYIASNETPDPLYLMTHTHTQDLFRKVGLEPVGFKTYEPNPQRLYYELYIKKQLPYRFADIDAQSTLQNYIDKIRTAPHTYESFTILIPATLQPGILDKYNTLIQTDINSIWSNIIKEVVLVIILNAVKYSTIIDSAYRITTADLNQAISEL